MAAHCTAGSFCGGFCPPTAVRFAPGRCCSRVDPAFYAYVTYAPRLRLGGPTHIPTCNICMSFYRTCSGHEYTLNRPPVHGDLLSLELGLNWVRSGHRRRVMAAMPLTFDCVGLGGLGPRSTQRGWHLVSWPYRDVFCMGWVGFGAPPSHRG